MVGVIGHPVSHSLSPRMHNASFAALGLDYAYVPLDVPPDALRDAVRGLVALGFRGFNVTMPHKEEMVSLVDDLDLPARVSGAVNTVSIEAGRTLGMNTDGDGFMEAAREAGMDFARTKVALIGAGGAAAAISTALLRAGGSELRIVNRSLDRAEKLRARLRGAFPDASVSVHAARRIPEAVRDADALVNTTYLGMKDEDPLPVPAEHLRGGLMVCDAVYRAGRETALVGFAKERGCRVMSGERMLLYQGVQAQRAWTGVEPDVSAMSEALSGVTG